MINWPNLAANALWIFALAFALATLSYASWQAAERGIRFRDQLNRRASRFFLNLAGFLFSNGLAFTSERGWEKALWFVLAALFLIQLVLIRTRRNS